MSQGPTLQMKRKLNFVVIVAVLLAFAVTSVSLVRVAIFQHDEYLTKATKQQLKSKVIPANRGTIYDRNMQVLARSATVWDVILAPANMKKYQKEAISKELARLLNPIDSKVTEEYIYAKTQKNNQYEIVTKKVEKEVADKIRELITKGTPNPENPEKTVAWAGVDLTENTKRYYPNSTLAASLVGFTGSDSQGLYGVELQYDEMLKGTPGYLVSAQNGLGETMPVNYEDKFDPVNGSNLVLTIDETVQHFLEKALDQVVKQHAPDEGCAGIVMDVNTGEILAMANRPTFDLNNPWVIFDQTALDGIAELPEEEQKDARFAAQQAQWSNKAVSYAYQPGSTFKTIVAAAALEEKSSSFQSTFYCPGYVIVEDRKMKCHKDGGHGQLDFTGALVGSCNPAFVKIGADLGANQFYKYFQLFGLTEKTGIDLPGEGVSQYYTADKLTTVSLASSSFGQSMAITPIQLVTAVSAVVNGGNVVTPHVLKDVLDENNNVTSSVATNVKRQAISQETSDHLRSMMEAVVNEKGGTNASIKGYRIGGKSGTSQKQNPGDSEEARIASYIAVAPADNPQIAVYVMVDEPTLGTSSFGSVIAAPAVASVMKDTLPYLGFTPKYTEEELAKLEVTTPYLLKKNILEAESKLSAVGLSKYEVIGDGTTIVKQVPSAGSSMPKDGTIYLYTETETDTLIEMPNVVGLSPSVAKSKLEQQKFNVIIVGEATEHSKSKITAQSINEGIMTPIGTVVEITCIKSDTD